jgi:hypothetical protein
MQIHSRGIPAGCDDNWLIFKAVILPYGGGITQRPESVSIMFHRLSTVLFVRRSICFRQSQFFLEQGGWAW